MSLILVDIHLAVSVGVISFPDFGFWITWLQEPILLQFILVKYLLITKSNIAQKKSGVWWGFFALLVSLLSRHHVCGVSQCHHTLEIML